MPFLYDIETGEILHAQRKGDAGVDLAYVGERELRLLPQEIRLVQTGARLESEGREDFVVDIRSRSGLTYKKGIIVANSPGTIDSGYTGEILVIVQNVSDAIQTISPGDRVAQAVFVPIIPQPAMPEERKNAGFGSTGWGEKGQEKE